MFEVFRIDLRKKKENPHGSNSWRGLGLRTRDSVCIRGNYEGKSMSLRELDKHGKRGLRGNSRRKSDVTDKSV